MKIKKILLGGMLAMGILSASSQMENIPLISAIGEGIATAKPDFVLIGIVFTKNLDQVDERISQLTRIFEPNETKIRIFGLNGQDNEESLIRVQGEKTLLYSKEVYIELRDVNRLDPILLEIRKQKLQLTFIEYRVTNHAQLSSMARKKAIASAKEKAQELANELGQSIGKAHLIEELETLDINWYLQKKEDLEKIRQISSDEYLFIPAEDVIYSKVKVSFDLIKN